MTTQPATRQAPAAPPNGRPQWIWQEDGPQSPYQLYFMIALEVLDADMGEEMRFFDRVTIDSGSIYDVVETAVYSALAAAGVSDSWQELFAQAYTCQARHFEA